MALELRVSGIGGALYEVSANREWTVVRLKKAFLIDIPVCDKRLFYNMREFLNSEKVSSIIEENLVAADLTVVLRPPGEANWIRQVRADSQLLRNAPEEIKHSRDVVLAAIYHSVDALSLVPEELRSDQNVALAAIERVVEHTRPLAEKLKWVLLKIAPRLLTDNNFLLAVLERLPQFCNSLSAPDHKCHGFYQAIAVSLAAEELWSDCDFMRAALSYICGALRCVSDDEVGGIIKTLKPRMEAEDEVDMRAVVVLETMEGFASSMNLN